MADITRMKEAISSLSECSSPILPERSKLIDNYVSVTCKEAIDNADDKEAYKQKMVDYYTNGIGSVAIDNMINDFNESYVAFTEGVEDLKTSIAQTTASNAIPAVIVAGSATGAANPAYTAIDNAQKKHVLKMNLRTLKMHVKKMLIAAVGLNYEVSDDLMSLIDVVSSLSSSISAIPG